MNKKIRVQRLATISILLSIFLLVLLTPSSVLGATESPEIYNSFSVSAVIPDNQINKNSTYFDLRVPKKHSQELQVRVNNDGNKKMVASVAVNNAKTGNNAVKVFNKEGKKDSSLKDPIAEMVKIKTPEVIIEPGKTGIIKLQLNTPDKELSGVILGGIVIEGTLANAKDSKDTNNNDNEFDVNSRVSYVIGLKLTMNDKIVKPNLNLLKVKAQLVDYRTSVIAIIQNDKPVIMNGVNIKGEIYKKGSSSKITSVNIKNGEISPNSSFNVVYDWNNQKLKAGDYRIHMKATYKKDSWEWDENFHIDNKSASKINDSSLFINDNMWLYLLIGGIILLLLVIVGIVIFKRRRKNKEA